MMNRLIIILIILVAATTSASSATDSPGQLTKNENIALPEVPKRQQQAMRDYIHREAQALKRLGYMVEIERNGEVIVVTIPANKLFLPNDTRLMDSGKQLLETYLAYLKNEDRFKVILAMHTDDTGSPDYKTTLSEQRLNAVIDYMEANAAFPEQIEGYALADDEPITNNNTRIDRAANRRLEIYIVPSNGLISRLKK